MRLGLAGKPSHTLLLVTPRVIARLDFTGRRKSRLIQVWSAATSHVAETSSLASIAPQHLSPVSPLPLGALVERAMQLGPKLLGKVSVLSTHFFSDVVMLQSDIAAMATPNELSHSLAIEAELDSQLSPFETQVAKVPMESDTDQFRAYCVTLISNSQVKELQKLVASKNASLYRLAHPLALSRPEEPLTRQTVTSSIEHWNDVSVEKGQLLEKADNLDLQEISERFINSLSRSASPLWLSPVTEPSLRHHLTLAAIFSATVGLSCIGHYSYTDSQLDAQKQRFAQLSGMQAEFEAKSAEYNLSQKRLVKVRADEQSAREARDDYQERVQLALRRKQLGVERWGSLLNAISTVSEDCWIRRIESDSHSTLLSGLAMEMAQAHALAARLDVALRGNGWQVSAATTNSNHLGLVEFSIALLPTCPVSPIDKPSRSIVFNAHSQSDRFSLIADESRRPH